MLERILLATDFSEPAALALRHARALAQRYGSEIELLTAIHAHEISLAPGPLPFPEPYLTHAWDLASHDLEMLAEPLRSDGLSAKVRVLRQRPDEAIREAALEIGANLIVIRRRQRRQRQSNPLLDEALLGHRPLGGNGIGLDKHGSVQGDEHIVESLCLLGVTCNRRRAHLVHEGRRHVGGH